MNKRCIVIVLDGVGIGELPDAAKYNDKGANTIVNIAEHTDGLNLPNLCKLGLGNITTIKGVPGSNHPDASYGKMAEKSQGKDSTTGHWEIAGLEVKTEFPLYPDGFPAEIINPFIKKTKVPGILCNKPYSGTEAMHDFGLEHLKTKKPIVYTSADSVFQIAVHEKIYNIDELYRMCEITRNEIFNDKINIGRVIARPFLGETPADFYRTDRRKDYSLDPPRETILDILKGNDLEVIGVGKIEDLFNFKGLTQSYHSKRNSESIDKTIEYIKKANSGMIFTNLVDFDTLWGHRNLPHEFARGLEYFDSRIPEIIKAMNAEDILFLTADHGCDPTTTSTDHSREYVPIIVFGKNLKAENLGIRKTFSDVAATIADYFKILSPENGVSFLKQIKNK